MSAARERCTGGSWEDLRALDPAFLESYVAMAEVPERIGALDQKTRSLVALAVDANVTHLDRFAVHARVREALEAGASGAEILEALECAATVSVHAMNVGVRELLSVLHERGERSDAAPLTPLQQKLKDDFTESRGYWNPTWDEILEVAPEMFAAYTEFSSHPWRTGHLSPLVKELIYIAFDTSVTHLYTVGLRLHIENALGYGATPAQILDVMETASLIGVKSVLAAAPLLRGMAKSGRGTEES